jgi:DNA polymerase I-like protein with 3'-5' exonuclease and polymerase domains
VLDPDKKDQTLQQIMSENLPKATFNLSGSQIDVCCREAMQISLLTAHFQKKLRTEGLLDHFFLVEMPLIHVLNKMELVGVGFVTEAFLACWDFFSEYLARVESEAHSLAGRKFSLCSPKEVGAILFDELEIPYPKEGDKRRSTNKAILTLILEEHAIVEVLMKHRTASTFVSNHLLPYMNLKKWSGIPLSFLNPIDSLGMHRVHPTYNYHTATGRITTTLPNLQNLPHVKSTEVEEIGLTLETVNLRDTFQPTGPGQILLSLDYCQLELRSVISFLYHKDHLVSCKG